MTAEQFLLRSVGGPFPGTRLVDSDQFPWPLPDALPDPECRGRYVKTGQSDLPPQPAGSHVIRGAVYRWQPADDQETVLVVAKVRTLRVLDDGTVNPS